MKKRTLLPISILVIVAGCSNGNTAFMSKVPDFSAYRDSKVARISGWIAPYHDLYKIGQKNLITQQAYLDMKEAGFNAIYAMYEYDSGVNDDSQLDYILSSMDYAQQAGIKYYAKSATVYHHETVGPDTHRPGDFYLSASINQYFDHPAFAGHLVTDEPSMSEFESLANLAKFYREELPGKEFYVNLFPSYATEDALGTANYEEYISKYLEMVKPDVLSFDHYSLHNSYGEMTCKTDSLYNREVVAYYANKANTPYMNFTLITSSEIERREMISQADISWQVMMDMAYGCSGAQYFCVFPPMQDSGFGYSNAVFDFEGNKTKFYDYVKAINAQVSLMDEAYLNYSWDGVMTKKGYIYDESKAIDQFESCDRSLESHKGIASYISSYNSIMGCFSSKLDNTKAYFLANFEDPTSERTNSVEIIFRGANHVRIYTQNEIKDMAITKSTLQYDLGPAEGVFLIPYNL